MVRPPYSATSLRQDAIAALRANDLGDRTRPTPGLYPHQWFWDSCFIAIGLRHLDVTRAQSELRSVVRGQWRNGMLPHIIFTEGVDYYASDIWQSQRHPDAPSDRKTSAITQPPVLAEAVWRIAERLPAPQRRVWLQEMFEPLVRYHTWLYRERDRRDEGLVYLLHSWESGLDNSPPWMQVYHPHRPLRVRTSEQLNLDNMLDLLRKDKSHAPGNERIRTKELFTVYHVVNRLRRSNYDIDTIIEQTTIPLVIDIVFNSILIRANSLLTAMAKELQQPLPLALSASMAKASAALMTLRSTEDNSFYHRDFRSHQLIKEPSIAGLLPLYSGALSQEQADALVSQLQDRDTFWLTHPVPSTPPGSRYFAPRRYWQGPVWVNMNWLLIDGLRRYGHSKLANELRDKTLAVVAKSGMHEYFSPLDGAGAGSEPFSWTAALTIDLLEQADSK